jgi:signal transduction histidine kinase
MSAVEMPAAQAAAPERRSGLLRDPAGRLTAVAGTLLLAGLAVAVRDPGAATLPLTLSGVGAVLALFVLGPLAAAAVRRHPGPLIGAAVVIVPLLLLMFAGLVGGVYGVGSSAGWFGVGRLVELMAWLLPPGVVVLAAIGGLVLLADAMRARLGLPRRTPWQRVTGVAAPAPARPWRAAAGVGLVGLAAVLGLGLVSAYGGGGGLLGVLLLLAVAAGALALVVAPVLVAGLARADRARVCAAREDERQRVAAHLHDSVLQTLALVQRQAHDPTAVARLARRQEHQLRAWMAGEAPLGSETLAAALQEAVAEVEDEHGARVEVTILGDRALDPGGEALAAAAREALRNAARHAPGAPLFVFAQAGADGAEVFVRDEGRGFELSEVPTERRGVRDAIIGRMAAAGGRATIDSAPGEGTEVALRVGRTGGRA